MSKCPKCRNKMETLNVNGDRIDACNTCGTEVYIGPKDIMNISNVKPIIKEYTRKGK